MGRVALHKTLALAVLAVYLSSGLAKEPLLRSWLDVNIHVAGFGSSPLVQRWVLCLQQGQQHSLTHA